MSVIQSIRDRYAGLVIGLIFLSLIAFIAMDAFVGRGRGGGGGTGSSLGKVNGEKINKDRFDNLVTLQQSGQQSIGREQAAASVWTQTVDEMIMAQEYEKIGLQLTNKELNDLLYGSNPPQWMSQYFSDGKGGVDINKAKQAFAQLKKQKGSEVQNINDGLIVPTINNQLRTKYMALVSQSAYIPKWMAEKTMADQNAVARFSYVAVPYASIVDSTIQVTDDDVRKYVSDHSLAFKQEESSRNILYVAFNASPAGRDSMTVFNQLLSAKADFAAATDADSYLNRVSSETPFVNDFIPASQLQVPNADTIKKLADGQVFGPYLDGTNYVIAKMIGRRNMPDSVKVRHILIKTADDGKETLADSVAKRRVDSISAAIQSGVDFNAMVLQYSDDEGSKGTKGEYDFGGSQFSTLTREFAEVAFYGVTGDKKTVKVESPKYNGYHYIEVLSQKNIGPAYKVAYLARPIVASGETINAANSAAAQFAASSRSKTAFEENAKKQNMVPLPATDLKENDFSLNGIGENRNLVKWIYESKVGDVSEPFDIGDKYIVALVTSVDEKGTMNVTKARPAAEALIRNEKKAQRILKSKFSGSFTSLEEVAKTAGQAIQVADSVGFAQPFIPQIGNEAKVAGMAFNKSLQGKVSKPVAGNTGVFVIRGESISAQANQSAPIDDQRRQMEMQLKQMGAYRAIEALKKAATVKDNRSEFY